MTSISLRGRCAISQGVIGVRGYLSATRASAGVMLAVSRSQALNPAGVAAACLQQKLTDVLGDGSSAPSQLSPCADRYAMNLLVDRVPDVHSVSALGTNQTL